MCMVDQNFNWWRTFFHRDEIFCWDEKWIKRFVIWSFKVSNSFKGLRELRSHLLASQVRGSSLYKFACKINWLDIDMINVSMFRVLWLCALTTEEAFTEVLDGRLTSKEGQTKNLKIIKMPEKVKTKPNTYPLSSQAGPGRADRSGGGSPLACLCHWLPRPHQVSKLNSNVCVQDTTPLHVTQWSRQSQGWYPRLVVRRLPQSDGARTISCWVQGMNHAINNKYGKSNIHQDWILIFLLMKGKIRKYNQLKLI